MSPENTAFFLHHFPSGGETSNLDPSAKKDTLPAFLGRLGISPCCSMSLFRMLSENSSNLEIIVVYKKKINFLVSKNEFRPFYFASFIPFTNFIELTKSPAMRLVNPFNRGVQNLSEGVVLVAPGILLLFHSLWSTVEPLQDDVECF